MKIINKLFIIVSILISGYYAYFYYLENNYTRVLTALLVIPLVMLPKLLSKILKKDINIWLETIYIIFVFLAQTLGTVASFYYHFNGYDKLVHMISGIVTSFLAIYILIKYKNNKSLLFNIIFIITFTLSIAAIWEIFEFLVDNILNMDVQWVEKTGVNDTMTDIIVAFIGSILFLIMYMYEEINNTKIIIKYYIESIKKDI